MNRNSPTLISFLVLSVFAGFQFGCNHPRQQNPTSKIGDQRDNPPPAVERIDFVPEVTPTVEFELSVESLANDAVENDKRMLAESREGGNSNAFRAMNGTEWLTLDVREQIRYLRGLWDLIEFGNLVTGASRSAIVREKSSRGLAFSNGNNTWNATSEVADGFRSRIMDVIAGRTNRDILFAITQFYQRKPLLKDKPVLWVLAIPLYKEIQESRSKPQPGSVDEAIEQEKEKVSVTMIKKK